MSNKIEMSKPRYTSVVNHGNQLELIVRKPKFLIIIPFIFVVVASQFIDIKNINTDHGVPFWVFLLQMTIFTYIGFKVLKASLNSTHIVISRGNVRAFKKPITLFEKERKIQTYQLEQIYVQEDIQTYRSSKGGTRTIHHYHVVAKLKNGNLPILATFDDDHETARYIEQSIEEFLKIKDVAIESEHNPMKMLMEY